MATKSITKTVDIATKRSCAKLVSAMENSKRRSVSLKETSNGKDLRRDEIAKFFGDTGGQL